MKKILRLLSPIIAFVAVFWCVTLGLMFAGCSGGCAVGKGQYDPTTGVYDTNKLGDVIVVTAESTRDSALNLFEAIMVFERNNDAALRKVDPKIHEFAEKVRRESEGWLNELTAAKTAYQRSRSAEDATKLKNVLALVQSMVGSASKYMAASVAATKANP